MSSLETGHQRGVILNEAHNFYFSELLPRSESEESIKNKSQKISMFQKSKCPQKDKIFEEVRRLQKKFLKSI